MPVAFPNPGSPMGWKGEGFASTVTENGRWRKPPARMPLRAGLFSVVLADDGGGMSGDSFAKGLESHLDSLQRYALLLTRNRVEADDLVQDCVAKAIASANQWRPGTDLRAWLFRILYTCHISDRRKQQVRTRYAEQASTTNNIEASQLVQVETRQVLSALDGLPDAQREAILVIALDDVKYEEAARRLGVPIGTFMSRLARGREALRRRMEADGETKKLRLVKGGRDA